MSPVVPRSFVAYCGMGKVYLKATTAPEAIKEAKTYDKLKQVCSVMEYQIWEE